MNIGYFNSQGINNIEHWFLLEIEELRKRGHEVRVFWLKGNQPTIEDIKWMDIAHFHFAQVAYHYKRIGIPFIISPHAHDIFRDEGETLKRASQHRNCIAVSFQSFYHKKKFEEWRIEKPMFYLPMCCRTELFKRDTSYNPNGKMIAGGRLVPKKGLHQLKSVENLTVFGDGSLRNELERILPDSTIFTGYLDGKGLKQLFEEANIYLFPAIITSNGDSDGIANTVKEAMLMELPVVTSSVAGMAELKNVIHLDDWSRIGEILNDVNTKQRNVEGKQEILRNYSPNLCVNRLLNVMEEFL